MNNHERHSGAVDIDLTTVVWDVAEKKGMDCEDVRTIRTTRAHNKVV